MLLGAKTPLSISYDIYCIAFAVYTSMPYGAGAVMYISLISFWWGVNFVRFCGSNNKIQLLHFCLLWP